MFGSIIYLLLGSGEKQRWADGYYQSNKTSAIGRQFSGYIYGHSWTSNNEQKKFTEYDKNRNIESPSEKSQLIAHGSDEYVLVKY